MPDYSACVNNECIFRYDCARYMMKSNSNWQTYCRFEQCNDTICEGWWAVKDAPFQCYTQEEMEVFEATREALDNT